MKPWELDKVPAEWYTKVLIAMNAEAEARAELARRNDPKDKGAGE